MIFQDSVYGTITTNDLIDELCETTPMLRLKKIKQAGPIHIIFPQVQTTRFEHSLGVAHLVEKLGGSIEEQITGLLHDISHTAFSHIIDYVLENEKEDYHEHHRKRFLLDNELIKILKRYHFDPKDFINEPQNGIVEQPSPHLSADRVDYTLRDLLAWKSITFEEAQNFLNNLTVIENRIVVKNIHLAKWFSDRYVELNESFFKNPMCLELTSRLTQALKYALNMNTVTLEDFFEDDEHIMRKLSRSNDPKIILLMANLKTINTTSNESKSNNIIILKNKTRTIDPSVLINGKVQLLSEYLKT